MEAQRPPGSNKILDQAENSSKQHLILIQPKFATIFLSYLTKDNQKKVLTQFLSMSSSALLQKKGYIDFLWEIECVLQKFNIVHQTELDLFPLYFQQISFKQNVFSRLFNENITHFKENALKYNEALLELYTEQKPLFMALYSNFSKFVNSDYEISILGELINKFGLNVLNLFSPPTFDSKIDIKSLSSKLAPTIFSAPYGYQTNLFSRNYQKAVISKSFFPQSSPILEGDWLNSMVNTCIVKESHFADILYLTGSSSFDLSNFQNGIRSLKLIPELEHWLEIGYLEKHSSPLLWDTLLPMISPHEYGKIASDTIERMKNDIHLFRFIKQTTGSIPSKNDFQIHSLPYLLRDAVEEASINPSELPKNLFSFSDLDLQNDSDFIAIYSLAILLINNPSSLDLTKFDGLLSLISPQYREVAAIDLFSLLFLEKTGNNSSERFLFPANTIEQVMSVLIPYVNESNGKLMKEQLKKLQIIRFIKSNANLDDVLVPISSLFCQTLISGQNTIAERYAAESPNFGRLFRVFQFVSQQHHIENINPLNIGSDRCLICSELGLSTKNNQSLLLYSKEHFQSSEMISMLTKEEIGQLLMKTKKPQIKSKAIPSQQLLNFATSLSHSLTVSNISLLFDIPEKLLKQIKKCSYLSQFVQYLQDIIPPLLKKRSTIPACLEIKPKDLVDSLLNEQEFEAAKKIASALHVDIVESVLSRSEHDHGPIAPFLGGEKNYDFLVKAADILSHSSKPLPLKSLDHLSQPLRNLLNHSKNQKLLSESINNKYDSQTLINIIHNDPHQNLEDILNMSFIMDEDEFIKIIESHMSEFSIEDLEILGNEGGCGCTISDEVFILKQCKSLNIEPFPLSEAFTQIINNEKFDLAANFAKTFRYQIDITKIIRTFIISYLKENKQPTPLLEICPSFKQEILESLPSKLRSQLFESESPFCGVLPKDWKISSDIQTTLLEHISETKIIVDILSRFPTIDFDSEIISHIQSQYDLNETQNKHKTLRVIKNIYKDFSTVFRNYTLVSSRVISLIDSSINQISVHSFQDEQICFNKLHQACQLLTLIKDTGKIYGETKSLVENSTFEKISSLEQFSSLFLFSKYHFEYTLDGFLSESFIIPLINEAFFVDAIEVADKLLFAYHINSTEMRDKYSSLCFSIGGYDEGKKNCVNRRCGKSMQSANESTKFAEIIINILSKAPLYDEVLLASLKECPQQDVTAFGAEFGLTPNKREKSIIRHSSGYFVTPGFQTFDNTPEFSTTEISNQNQTEQFSNSSPFHTHEDDSSDKESILSKNHLMTPERHLPKVKFATPNFSYNDSHNLVRSYSSTDSLHDQSKLPESNGTYFYSRLKAICNKEISNKPTPLAKEVLNQILETFCRISDQVKYLVSIGDFSKAFDCMNFTQKGQARWSLFFESIALTSFSYDNQNRMKFRIRQVDPSLSFFGSYLERLLRFSRDHQLIHLELELDSFLERSEEAALAALHLCDESDTTAKEKLRLLEIAQRSLGAEISKRNTRNNLSQNHTFIDNSHSEEESNSERKTIKFGNQDSPHKKSEPHKPALSSEQVQSLQQGVLLQSQFVKYCVDIGLEECTYMSLFKDQQAAEEMAVFLFKDKQFPLAIDIISMKNLSPGAVGERLIDMMVNEPESSVVDFVNGLHKNKCSFFEELISHMVMRLYFVHGMDKLTMDLIATCDVRPEFQCKLMIQFGKIEDAFKSAKTHKLFSLLPLIGHLAHEAGQQSIVNEATKILSHNK